MIKGIALAKQKAGMDSDAFHRYWRQTHGPLALQMSKLRRYVQSHKTKDIFPGFEECFYDGVAHIWFDDLATLQAMPSDPEYINGAQADEPNFVDMAALKFIATEEKLLIDEIKLEKDTQCLKAVFLLTRKPGMSVTDFQDYWLHGHGPQIPRDAGVLRYTQSHTLEQTYIDDTPAYDGVAELTFKDYAAFIDYWTSEQVQAIFAEDAPRFLDAVNCTAFLADDYRVLWPS